MNRGRLIEIGGLLVILLGYLSLAGSFAANQSIWVDETTQLSGLALPFNTQMQWLTGKWDGILGVPPDRMPPLSYWIGSVWASIFGLSENSLRWMGIIAVALAMPALHLSGRQIAGVLGGLFVTGLLLFSATVIGTASSIRAYPIFFALMSWVAWFYVRLVLQGETTKRLICISVLLLAATYTHFYGLIASGCVFLALFIVRLSEGVTVVRTLLAAFSAFAGSVGLLPFVSAAISVSNRNENSIGAGINFFAVFSDAIRLVYRTVASPPQLGVSFLTPVHIGAFFTLLFVLAYLCAQSRRSLYLLAPALPVFIGFIVLFFCGAVIKSFAIFSPSYNIWMIPFFAFTAAGALTCGRSAKPKKKVSFLTFIAGFTLIATNFTGSVIMILNASLYSNGAGDWVSSRISEWNNTLVIHRNEGPWGSLYFSLFYNSGGTLEQWLLSKDGTLSRITPMGLEFIENSESAKMRFQVVFEAESFQMSSTDLAKIVRGQISCSTPNDGQLSGKESEVFCAYLGVRLSH